ncbi:hypothetical protein Q4E93_04075 [Flavitalea sp. BT771]|nr:hypothetical protein [Flavitalea sp. BT771]MDO6429745.1 hypothetical protein [Flavitalea sp. BT771]MDV6218127.1 hypothetical protein [Flavitalea sp. BT771]
MLSTHAKLAFRQLRRNVLLVALATTLMQSLKAAVVNPVDSLRSE